MKLNQIKLGGDPEKADDLAEELRKYSSDKGLVYELNVGEIDLDIEIYTESDEEFAGLDNKIAGLVQEYMGEVTVLVE
jgi:hypothetical protein